MRESPTSEAVVLTFLPSEVVSSKAVPKLNWVLDDLKVEEVSIPILPPGRFLLVALG